MKLLIFTLLLLNVSLFAQKTEDVDLMRNNDFDNTAFVARKVTYGFSENPSKFALFNPLYHILSGSMYIYQRFISPQLATQCMFVPSCSEYSRQLISDFGIAKGVFCSADRLMRCNRIALTGLPASTFNAHDRKIHESTDRYVLNKE